VPKVFENAPLIPVDEMIECYTRPQRSFPIPVDRTIGDIGILESHDPIQGRSFGFI